jgi:uncharacterized protein (TIGR02996 family)
MDEADFLRALAQEPRDETVRAIYADWLDERGDPRGEYLRLERQVALIAESDPQSQALEGRLRTLLVEIDPHWLGKVALRFDLFLVTDVAGLVNRVLPRWLRVFESFASFFSGRAANVPLDRIRIRSKALWKEADDLRGRLRGMLLSGELDMPVRVQILPAGSMGADCTIDLGEILAQRPMTVTEG